MLTFNETNDLFEETIRFLKSCGGIYKRGLAVGIQENVMFCIATGQFILYRDVAGRIEHFLCYWRVSPDDVELIQDGVQPGNRVSGSVLYIVEHGNRAGMASMWRAIRELRKRSKGMSGLIFNHKGEGVKCYPSQKGE